MNDNHLRLASLNSAAGLCVLRRSLGATGASSIVWGVIWFSFALASRFGRHPGGRVQVIVSGLIGAFLIAEGIYVLRTRSRLALGIEAVTLGLLGAFDLCGSCYGWYLHLKGTYRGPVHNPVLGFLLVANACKSWSARKRFAEFSASSTEGDIAGVESIIRSSLPSACSALPSVVQLRKTGLIVGDNGSQWLRIWFDQEFAYLINISTFFNRRARPVAVTACNRSGLSFDVGGESWLGRSKKVKLIVDGVKADAAYEITPEMLEKLSALTGVPVG